MIMTVSILKSGIYAQSDFADDSNFATFIVSENVSDPVVFESDKCRFIIHLKESDLVADKMISLLEGVHKNRRISFLNDDIVKPTGSADITPEQVDAKLKEPITARIKTPIPKSMKEHLGYESHPDESAAVDLGLSVKWAPFNIGAEKPEDNGVTNWSPDGLSDQAIRLFEHIGTSVMAGDREHANQSRMGRVEELLHMDVGYSQWRERVKNNKQ